MDYANSCDCETNERHDFFSAKSDHSNCSISKDCLYHSITVKRRAPFFGPLISGKPFPPCSNDLVSTLKSDARVNLAH